MNLFQRIANSIFGIDYVLLKKYDNEFELCQVKYMNSIPFAMLYGRTYIKLLPNGSTEGSATVNSWEPVTKKISKYYDHRTIIKKE